METWYVPRPSIVSAIRISVSAAYGAASLFSCPHLAVIPQLWDHIAQGGNQSPCMFERSDSQAYAALASWIGTPVAYQNSSRTQSSNEFGVGGTGGTSTKLARLGQ